MIRKFIQLAVLIWLGATLGFSAWAQDYALRGVVLNESLAPVGGAQVSINGSSPVISTPKEGRFQVLLKNPPTGSELDVVVNVSGYRLRSKELNSSRKEVEIVIEPIFKTLGGWVRTADKVSVSGVLIKFKNSSLEKTAVTDRDGFFRIQLPSETPVTIADFAVESYKVNNGNIELRKVKDDNLKFVQENTFVFLTVSSEDLVMEIASTDQAPEHENNVSAKEEKSPKQITNSAQTQSSTFTLPKNSKDLKTLVELIGEKRGENAVKGSYAQVISKEIEMISAELSRLQSQVSNAVSEQDKVSAEEAFTAYINDDYIRRFIESLRTVDPNNPLVILLEKYKRDNQEILNAKNESDRQLSIIASQFKASKLVSILLLALVFVALFFALSNNRKKKKLQEATQKLEEERRRLEILNEELKTLMGIVAHDLKAPLNKVVGLTQLMPLVGSLNDEQAMYVSMVNQVAHDGRQFIENLLDLKAIEEQKRRLQLEPLDIIQWVNRSIIGYEQTANKKNIQLVLETTASEGWITVDKSAFGQIVDNLVSNAIKFSPLDKNIFIRIDVGYSLVSIAIKDEGPGISEEDQQKMFKRFQRLSARPTAGEHSSGLGLSIVKMLVEQMNGEIHLESSTNRGCTFTVYFHKHVLEETLEEITNS